MKRIISLCCIVILLVTILAMPVHADEIDISSYINVLDYATANNSGSNRTRVASDLKATMEYDIPSSPYIRYVDAVVLSISGNLNAATCDGNSLTVTQIGTRLYRVYGTFSVTAPPLTFVLTGSSSSTQFEFLSLKAGHRANFYFEIEAYCDIASAEFEDTIHYVPSDEINHRIFDTTDSFTDTFFFAYIRADNWKLYDFLDFQLMFDVFEITSISAMMGGVNIPVEYSYVDGTAIEGNSFLITMRLDVSNLDRTIDDYPMIVVMGRLDSGTLNSIDFINATGIVKTNDFDQFDSLDAYLGSIEQLLGTIDSDVLKIFTLLDVMNVIMQRELLSVNQNLELMYTFQETYSRNMNTVLEGFRSSMAEEFRLLKSAISDHFTALETYLGNLHADLTLTLNNWFTAIDNQLTTIRSSIHEHTEEIKSSITDMTNTLEAAIRGNTKPGDTFQDEVDQELDELDQAQDVLDSVTKPDVKDINVSVDSLVSQADIQVLASPMAVFFGNQIIGSIIIMSILLATVSYVLYGKR